MSLSSKDSEDQSYSEDESMIGSNPHPLSPVIIIKTKNFRSYRKPKPNRKRVKFIGDVWPESEWLALQFNRIRAEEILKSTKNGTFLIRKSSEFNETGFYAMSIAFNQNVYHCLIEKYLNGYGFDSTRIFPSLEELVSYYKNFESLSVHNKILLTRLQIPALSQQNIEK